MSLEVNKNDQSLDTRTIPSSKGMFKRTVAGLLTTIMIFSGSFLGAQEVHATEETGRVTSSISTIPDEDDLDPATIIEIPEVYKYSVASACGKETDDVITIADLANFNDPYFCLRIDDNSSLEWLNYVKGVEAIVFVVHTDNTDMFKDIKKLNGFTTFYLSTWNDLELNKENFSFLTPSTDINTLSIDGFILEPDLIEGLTHLDKLKLWTDGNYKVDFTKLTFLDKLEFPSAGPYDVAIDLTSEEYYTLINNGVEIEFDTDEELVQYKQINSELDEIVASLNVDENSTDQEKLDAILIYVLDNLTYDPQIADLEDIKTDEAETLIKSFYVGGNLYAALEKDTAICGNYAALTNALAERLGLNTYQLNSDNHSWSLIEIEGEQYYVDSTWIDTGMHHKQKTEDIVDSNGFVIGSSITFEPVEPSELIKNGETEELDWYLEDPTSYPASKNQKEAHIAINLPSFYKITPKEEVPETVQQQEPTTQETEVVPITTTDPSEETLEEIPEVLDEEKFEVKIGNKTWIIGGAAAVGIMSALGGAIAVKKKKERERRKRRQEYTDYFYDGLTTTSFSSDEFSKFLYDTSDDYYGINSKQTSNRNRRGKR